MGGINTAFQTLHSATGKKMQVRHSHGEHKNEHVVEKDHVMLFITDLISAPNQKFIEQNTAQLMFEAIYQDGSDCIDQEEFSVFCGMLNYEFWVTDPDSAVRDMFPCI